MEIFIGIIVVIVVIYFYFKFKPAKPYLRKDIEPVDEPIPLSDGKKILRELLKSQPELVTSGEDWSKPEVNQSIRDEVDSFSWSFKERLQEMKDEIEQIKIDIKENDYDDTEKAELESQIEKLKARLKSKDCANDLLWLLNDKIGIDKKTNADLSWNNYMELPKK